jgi:hypothetical protein
MISQVKRVIIDPGATLYHFLLLVQIGSATYPCSRA